MPAAASDLFKTPFHAPFIVADMSSIPTDYPRFSPYLGVPEAARAIEFYKAAFGAEEILRLTNAFDGKIGHAELLIDGHLLMLSEENPDWGNKSPRTLGGTPVTFCLIVENADAALQRAVAAGATVVMPAADQFYGFRSATILDPFGHQWMLQHQLEKLSPEEMQRRWDALTAQGCGPEGD